MHCCLSFVSFDASDSRLALLALITLISVSRGPCASAAEADFNSNGVKIHYLDEGQGPPVILIHGFSSSGAQWGPLKEILVKDFCVIALDCRGHGKSDKPHDPLQYGKENVEDVVRLLDHLGIKKAHVVGYSMGAGIAGNMVLTHPNRVQSVVLGAWTAWFEPQRELLDLVELTAKGLEDGQGIAPLILASKPPKGQPKATPDIAKAISDMILGTQDQLALAGVVRGEPSLEVTADQLQNNKTPTLVIFGSKEDQPGIPDVKKHLNRVANLMHAEVRVIAGGDHVSTMTMPAFCEAVSEFLKKHADDTR